MTEKRIKKADFKLTDYVGNKAIKQTTFVFKESDLKKLPLIEDGSKDIFDAAMSEPGFSLVLRLAKRSKVFYFKAGKSFMKKIGAWQERTNSRHYPEGFFSLQKARKEFESRVKEHSNYCATAATTGDWTIEKYIDEKYESDRKIHKIKNGDIKPLEGKKVLKNIKSDLKPWLNMKLKDVNKELLTEFSEYWGTPRANVTNGVVQFKSKDSQRKAYTMINSMFNICATAKYITSNPLDGHTYLFKDKESQERRINTYDINPDGVLRFIFEESPGNFAGKIVIATMIMAGVRNSEAYRNFRENFDIENGNLHIPASISRKTKKMRDIPITSEYYWNHVRIYLSSRYFFENQQGHMFPSHKMSATGHVGEGITRETWAAIKLKYGLKKTDRLYDFRHTFATKLTKETGISEAALIIGDKPETLSKYYIKHDIARLRTTIAKIQNGNPEEVDLDKSGVQQQTNLDEIVTATDDGMPTEVKVHFSTYKNGKVLPGEHQLYKSQWDSFITIMRKMSENGMVKDADLWLQLQD